MFWLYLGEVIKRALLPTPRVTDGLQVLAASAFPAVGKFVGIKMPTDIGNDTLAYIGAATLAFIFIRLVWAPYAIWKDQNTDMAGLRLELSKPERLLFEKLVKHRARARIKLAAELEDFQTISFSNDWSKFAETKTAQEMVKIRRLQAESGLCDIFNDGRQCLLVAVKNEVNADNEDLPLVRESQRILRLLQRHLLGEITAETLALQLRPNTATKTQQ
jgi:hypothetical protein